MVFMKPSETTSIFHEKMSKGMTSLFYKTMYKMSIFHENNVKALVLSKNTRFFFQKPL